MLPLIYELGFKQGRISLPDVVRITSTNTARIHNIHPRKGTIAPGSDADLLVIPKDAPARQLTHDNLHTKAD